MHIELTIGSLFYVENAKAFRSKLGIEKNVKRLEQNKWHKHKKQLLIIYGHVIR